MQKNIRYHNRWTPVRSYLKYNDFTVDTLSNICDIIDESNKLNKNVSVIFLELILSFLLCISLDMGTNSLTWLKLYTNIESDIQINFLLSDHLTFMWVCQGCILPMLFYNIAAEVLANFINADKSIKGMQEGDNEIKIVKPSP